MNEERVTVQLAQRQHYQFDNRFGAPIPALLTDLPPPLGAGAGPSPEHLLASAVGNCLSASLLFALRKFNPQAAGRIGAEVTIETGRNAERRLRVTGLHARITIGDDVSAYRNLDRALAGFEDFCTVTASVRTSIPVAVQVFDARGVQLK
ncbi:MAG: OsmC family protein [Ideonella sp.]|nr:OsmC family protein [Ideonella sp.]MCC7455924.1 OsmC family protein [Nitrospira sp.]